MDADNPFSIFSQTKQRPSKNLQGTFKLLVFAAAALVLLALAHQAWQKRSVGLMAESLPRLPAEERSATLTRIAEYDLLAIDPLVKSLSDPSPGVAAHANALLADAQRKWMTCASDQRRERLLRLAESLARHNSERSVRYATDLANELIREVAGKTDASSEQIYRLAIETMNRGSDSAHVQAIAKADQVEGNSALSLDSASPVGMAPLELERSVWTEWPPNQAGPRAAAPTIVRAPTKVATEVVPTIQSQPALLAQTTREPHALENVSHNAEPKPVQSPAVTIRPVVHQAYDLEFKSREDAIAHLQSLSHLVRLKAIHFLGKDGTDQSRQALRSFLTSSKELHPTESYKIREILDRQSR